MKSIRIDVQCVCLQRYISGVCACVCTVVLAVVADVCCGFLLGLFCEVGAFIFFKCSWKTQQPPSQTPPLAPL